MKDRVFLNVAIPRELKKKVEEMAAHDRREKSDFVRLLLEDEWKRRNAGPVEGNGER